ncbi:hypothetical protein QBC43DRAFT_361001 [Cladorrhinum sp. PSN259]|nr:hypothetical protein QBC43DRAFT_361001 [Cladorrhinum sp. PSN259]
MGTEVEVVPPIPHGLGCKGPKEKRSPSPTMSGKSQPSIYFRGRGIRTPLYCLRSVLFKSSYFCREDLALFMKLRTSPTHALASAPQCSWHTFSNVQWSHSATMEGERTSISSRLATRSSSVFGTLLLPTSAVRRLDPHHDWKGNDFFMHESRADPEQEFTYPIQLSSPFKRGTPSTSETQVPAQPHATSTPRLWRVVPPSPHVKLHCR